MGTKKISTEKSNLLANLNKFMLSENLTNNATSNLWKKEVLKDFNSEKTARRTLRNMQFKLSKHLLAMKEIKNVSKIAESKKALIDFYKTCLVDKTKFSNKSKDSADFEILKNAFELVSKDL